MAYRDYQCPNGHIVIIPVDLDNMKEVDDPTTCSTCNERLSRVPPAFTVRPARASFNEVKRDLKGQMSQDEYEKFSSLGDLNGKYRIASKKEVMDSIQNSDSIRKARREKHKQEKLAKLHAWRRGKGIPLNTKLATTRVVEKKIKPVKE